MNDGRHHPVSEATQGSGEGSTPPEPAFLAIGRVLRPHGVRGELRVEIHTDYPERFGVYRRVYLGSDHTAYQISGHRFHQGRVLLKLREVTDRTAAEELRGQWVYIAMEDALPLAEGEVYLHDMLGLRVLTVEGEELGEVTDLIETGANPVYVVRGMQGEILIPDIPDVIEKIDLEAGELIVHLMEGLR
jgi:16S rRNA processing protein RimM